MSQVKGASPLCHETGPHTRHPQAPARVSVIHIPSQDSSVDERSTSTDEVIIADHVRVDDNLDNSGNTGFEESQRGKGKELSSKRKGGKNKNGSPGLSSSGVRLTRGRKRKLEEDRGEGEEARDSVDCVIVERNYPDLQPPTSRRKVEQGETIIID